MIRNNNNYLIEKNFAGVLLILGMVLNVGCVSMSGLQTARTIEPGKGQATFGLGVYNSDSLLAALEDDQIIGLENISAPYLEASYRMGLTESWDAGFRLAIIGSMVADAKYALLDEEKLALAIGAGVGYLSIESEAAGTRKYKTNLYDLMLPFYASYDFTETFAAYLIPKGVYRLITGDESGSALMGGATGGIKVGKTWGSYLEGSYLKDFGSEFTATQFNVALFFETDALF